MLSLNQRRRNEKLSGGVMARTGLRMMPTSPSPSLRVGSATVPIHRRLGFRSLPPVAAAPVRLRNVGTDGRGLERHQARVTVIALITLACTASTCSVVEARERHRSFEVPQQWGRGPQF